MKLKNSTIFRISEDQKKLAYQNIISHAIRKNTKPENFSEYLRRLLNEDVQKNREELRKQYIIDSEKLKGASTNEQD
jgi:uncharacterized protein YeaC (DUF1315 family)